MTPLVGTHDEDGESLLADEPAAITSLSDLPKVEGRLEPSQRSRN